ncbi:MAG: dextranase, partial [Pseudothermotoga sp.]|nr:dextranase [Pseudothermotoga sp.]
MRAIFDKAYYCPGDTIVLHIESSAENLFRVRFLKLTDCVFETITTKKNIEIVVPPNAFGGYGVDIEALDEHNEVVDKIHRGITVAKKWSDFPVYGYLTDFRPKRYDIEKTLNW